MTDRIRIAEPVRDICARLGLEPSTVASIEITPTTATVVVYKLRGGAKYIEDGEAVVDRRSFEVET